MIFCINNPIWTLVCTNFAGCVKPNYIPTIWYSVCFYGWKLFSLKDTVDNGFIGLSSGLLMKWASSCSTAAGMDMAPGRVLGPGTEKGPGTSSGPGRPGWGASGWDLVLEEDLGVLVLGVARFSSLGDTWCSMISISAGLGGILSLMSVKYLVQSSSSPCSDLAANDSGSCRSMVRESRLSSTTWGGAG